MDRITRFWAKVDISAGPYGCWIWTASRYPFGYGRFMSGGRDWASHRWLINYLRGRPLTRDEVVRHKCDNPPCCNPTHLCIGTQAENVRDREERGRSGSGKVNAVKTHCLRGHEYTEANTLVKRSMRNCRTCHRDRERQRRLTQKEG